MIGRIVFLVLSFFLLVSSYALLVRGADDYRAWSIWNNIHYWDRVGEVRSDRLIESNMNLAQSLSLRYPENTQYLYLSAKMHEWMAYQQRLSPRNREKQLVNVNTYLTRALDNRPFWGRGWGARLVNIGKRHRKWNSDSTAVLRKAVRFGRYDHATQYYLSHYAVLKWNKLPDSEQRILIDVLRKPFKNSASIGRFMRQFERSSRHRSLFDALKIRPDSS